MEEIKLRLRLRLIKKYNGERNGVKFNAPASLF
jgi:hypothetical protein